MSKSAARLYWGEQARLGFFRPKGVKIPVAASAFPDELYQAPRSWAEQACPKLIHYNKLPKGGHFAAWELFMMRSLATENGDSRECALHRRTGNLSYPGRIGEALP
jgi:hypothetical protein